MKRLLETLLDFVRLLTIPDDRPRGYAAPVAGLDKLPKVSTDPAPGGAPRRAKS